MKKRCDALLYDPVFRVRGEVCTFQNHVLKRRDDGK
jgi:hypothetical protein